MPEITFWGDYTQCNAGALTPQPSTYRHQRGAPRAFQITKCRHRKQATLHTFKLSTWIAVIFSALLSAPSGALENSDQTPIDRALLVHTVSTSMFGLYYKRDFRAWRMLSMLDACGEQLKAKEISQLIDEKLRLDSGTATGKFIAAMRDKGYSITDRDAGLIVEHTHQLIRTYILGYTESFSTLIETRPSKEKFCATVRD